MPQHQIAVATRARSYFHAHRQAVPADCRAGQAVVAVPTALLTDAAVPLRNGLIVQVTGDQRPIRHWPQCRFLSATTLEGVRASRVEVAARGPVDRARDVTLEDYSHAPCARLRHWHRG